MKSIGKRKFIVMIVGFAVMVILLWVILLTVILGNDDDSGSSSKKSSKKTKTEKVVEADQQEEKENREKDEFMAEEIRHSAEILTVGIAEYDEIMALIGDTGSYVAFFSVGEGGLKWEKDAPTLATGMREVYGDRLDKFSWNSEKYKGQRYTVYYKRPVEGASTGAALTVIGKWEGEE